MVLLVLWGNIKAFLPICGQSQSGGKEKDHWTLVLEVKKSTQENVRIFPGLFQDEKEDAHKFKCLFNAMVSPKEFKTLNNQISSPSSLKEELLKNRV